MDTHGVAGDLGDVLLGERDLVASVSRSDEIGEIFDGAETGLLQDFVHGQLGRLRGVDLALERGVRDDFPVLVEDDGLRVGGAYVTASIVFHSISSSHDCGFFINFNYKNRTIVIKLTNFTRLYYNIFKVMVRPIWD